MADITLKLVADRLGKSLEKLAPAVEEELKGAIRNLAHAAYTKMVAQIQSKKMGDSSRADYLKSLKFKELGRDSYLIYLDGEAAKRIEEGFGSYSLRQVLLKSTKIVQVGSRSGKPWVQINKKGGKYAHVPFEHSTGNKPSPTGNLAVDIKQMMAVNAKGKMQNIKKIFKDIDGNPIHGKVATISDAINDKFQGLTKYQHVHPSGKVSSVYMTYRTVSENGKDWIHPGSHGINAFRDIEKYVEEEMQNIINVLLK